MRSFWKTFLSLFMTGALGFTSTGIPYPTVQAQSSIQSAQQDSVSKILKNLAVQAKLTQVYDPAYRKISFPGGDVEMTRGVCSDVVIRAFRAAGLDLQVEVHQDMKKHFSAYPKMWGLKGPDHNIDHRRVPNLMKFFERRGKALPLTQKAGDYLPGDVVAWRLPNGLFHIGVVSNQKAAGSERFLMVHNIGYGTQYEDILFAYTLLGHYRYF